MEQVRIYAALFLLEYKREAKPFDIEYDLRIYQNDDVIIDETDPEEIARIMDRIKYCDKILEDAKEV